MIINSLKKLTIATLATAICVISSPSTLAGEDDCCACCFGFLNGRPQKSERLLPKRDIERAEYSPPQREALTPTVKKELSAKLEALLMKDDNAAKAIQAAIDEVNEDASFDITFKNAKICKLKVTTNSNSTTVVVKLTADSLL